MRKTALLTIAALVLASCGNFLNVQPQGYVIPSTDEEFSAILHTILNDIEGGGDEYVIGNMDVISRREGCADDLDANIKVGSITSYAGEIINSRMTDYRETYEIIKDCNILIENMEGRTSNEARNMLGSALAIKGICYYNLVRDFCEAYDANAAATQLGLVLVDRFDISESAARSDLRTTGEYVEDLLKRSIDLGQTDGKYFFTEWIVKSYLARTYFWEEKWDACQSVCEDILKNSPYKLTEREDYEAMIMADNAIRGEVITRSHINNASELDWYFSYVKGYIKSRPASASLVKLFGDDPARDIRYAIGFNGKRICQKTPECRVRLSEIQLMLAECFAHKGEDAKALSLVNELRSKRIEGDYELRADSLPSLQDGERIRVDAEGKDLTPVMKAVLDERRRELFLEGDRWFELKRNGSPEWWIISNGLKYTTYKYLYTAPIYKSDVDVYDNIIQNDGYEK